MNSTTTEQPVRSLQNFLRRIARSDPRIPPVIPDGIYGNQTRRSVSMFQLAHGIPATGRTDERTWNAIIDEYSRLVNREQCELCVCIFPYPNFIIEEGTSHESLYPLQGLMKVVSGKVTNIGDVKITGVHDRESVSAVRKLQRIMGHEVTGQINRTFYEDFIALYHSLMKS